MAEKMNVAPTRPKGPPLNAMRAFEAAARLGSFVAAAEELGVTPGAVSQHIKTLEGWSGLPLFRRNAQGVELTDAGRGLMPQFVAAFDALGSAARALRDQKPAREIHLAALPGIAQLWLPSRLGRVRRRMPVLVLSVTAMESAPNLARELFDMSLFFQPTRAGPNQLEIERDVIFPVCAPDLAATIQTPEEIGTLTLLQDQTWSDDWAIWSKATGIKVRNPHQGPRYSLYALAVEEAKSGAGVLMGHHSLVGEALRAGSLVPLFDLRCETGKSLVLTLPERRRGVTDPERCDLVKEIVGLLSEKTWEFRAEDEAARPR